MKLVNKISEDLSLDPDYLEKVVKRANCYYRKYFIPKKDGGKREIMQAGPELKSLQYWVRENVLKKLPVSSASYAYSKGNSVKKHALLHSKSNFILHADIRNFFPSVTPHHLEDQLKKYPQIFKELDIDICDAIATIAKICFKKDGLCIGTVSSPAISNAVMYDFDNELISYCKDKSYLCSRYADDIYISSNNFIPEEEKSYLASLLAKYGFELNEQKTYFASKKGKRSVTGIIVTDDETVSIGLERRLQIKKMIYNKLVHGNGNSKEIFGHLAFLRDIEPDYYNKIIIKYSSYCKEDILKELKKN